MSDFATMQQRALEIRAQYRELNQKEGHAKWQGKEFMLGFVGDVGDLAKLVMAKENLRPIEAVDAKLAHELADCLWSVSVLAQHYKVDLETEFFKTMNELERRTALQAKKD